MIKVKIENVCNISNGELTIQEGKLNIKYGYNGIGKTSISRAIQSKVVEDFDENLIIPFDSGKSPNVIIDPEITSLMVFDRNYIKQCLFIEDDVLHGTYDLVIKSQEYDRKLNQLNSDLKEIKELCSSSIINQFFEEIVSITNEMDFTKNNRLSFKSKAFKGFKKGINLDKSIPKQLRKYKLWLSASFNFNWIKWVQEGQTYVQNNKCPFCLKKIKPTVLQTISEFNSIKSGDLKDNMHSKSVLFNLSKYSAKPNELNKIRGNQLGIKQQELIYKTFKKIGTEKEKISKIKELDLISLVNLWKEKGIKNSLLTSKIDPSFIYILKNKELSATLEKYNDCIDALINNIETLKEDWGKFNKVTASEIKKEECYINDFLKISGIPYRIQVRVKGDNLYHSVLIPMNSLNRKSDNHLENAPENLSYGELNALCLVLFSMEVKAKKPKLVILDDPVSSFDSNKYFAILDYLFLKKEAIFKGKTVLLITHDMATLLTFLRTTKENENFLSAKFLNNKNGVLSEKELTTKSLDNTLKIEANFSEDNKRCIISRVAHLRKYFEIKSQYGIEYDILSSLIHLKENPTNKRNNISQDDLSKGIKSIREFIPDFDYTVFFKKFNDLDFIRSEFDKDYSSNDKLIITRLFIHKMKIVKGKSFFPKTSDNSVFWHFICNSYHIENLFIFGINDKDYNEVPNYIISFCEDIVHKSNIKP